MADQLYQIAFTGKVIDGAELALVKKNIAKLFNASEQQLAAFFSGKKVVIKNKIDLATAKKYQAALNKAGAECLIEKMGGVSSSPKVAAQAAASTHKANAPAQVAPAKSVVAPQQGTSAAKSVEQSSGVQRKPTQSSSPVAAVGAFEVAPVGADLGERDTAPPPPAPDVSHITVAEVGATIGNESKAPPPPAPDVSHLTMGEVGERLEPENNAPIPPAPDVSGISVAPLGSDLVEHEEDIPVVVPDISHLSVEDVKH